MVDNLNTFICRLSWNLVASTCWNPQSLWGDQPDQEGNKLQRQKILIFIYCTYNNTWRNISTIYITGLASNEIFSPPNKIHREVGPAKNLSAPPYFTFSPAYSWQHEHRATQTRTHVSIWITICRISVTSTQHCRPIRLCDAGRPLRWKREPRQH